MGRLKLSSTRANSFTGKPDKPIDELARAIDLKGLRPSSRPESLDFIDSYLTQLAELYILTTVSKCSQRRKVGIWDAFINNLPLLSTALADARSVSDRWLSCYLCNVMHCVGQIKIVLYYHRTTYHFCTVRETVYCLYTQVHLLLAALVILKDTHVGRCSGPQDSVLTWLADLLSSGNKLRAQDHAATELACLRWATATGSQMNRTTLHTMMPIFDLYLHLYRRNVFTYVVGLVICGTTLFAKFLPVRFVKSTLKLNPNIY